MELMYIQYMSTIAYWVPYRESDVCMCVHAAVSLASNGYSVLVSSYGASVPTTELVYIFCTSFDYLALWHKISLQPREVYVLYMRIYM